MRPMFTARPDTACLLAIRRIRDLVDWIAPYPSNVQNGRGPTLSHSIRSLSGVQSPASDSCWTLAGTCQVSFCRLLLLRFGLSSELDGGSTPTSRVCCSPSYDVC